MDQTNEKQTPLTEEEVAQLRERMVNFYQTELPVLELQAKYERYQAEIAVDRYRKLEAEVRLIQLRLSLQEDSSEPIDESNLSEMDPAKDNISNKDFEQQSKERTLKPRTHVHDR